MRLEFFSNDNRIKAGAIVRQFQIRLSFFRPFYALLKSLSMSLIITEASINHSKVHSCQSISRLHDPVTWYKITHRKLHNGTSKTKACPGGLVRVTLFWKSHCARCAPPRVILYYETGSCKGRIPPGERCFAVEQMLHNQCYT